MERKMRETFSMASVDCDIRCNRFLTRWNWSKLVENIERDVFPLTINGSNLFRSLRFFKSSIKRRVCSSHCCPMECSSRYCSLIWCISEIWSSSFRSISSTSVHRRVISWRRRRIRSRSIGSANWDVRVMARDGKRSKRDRWICKCWISFVDDWIQVKIFSIDLSYSWRVWLNSVISVCFSVRRAFICSISSKSECPSLLLEIFRACSNVWHWLRTSSSSFCKDKREDSRKNDDEDELEVGLRLSSWWSVEVRSIELSFVEWSSTSFGSSVGRTLLLLLVAVRTRAADRSNWSEGKGSVRKGEEIVFVHLWYSSLISWYLFSARRLTCWS